MEAIKRESILASGHAWSTPSAESRYMNTVIERTGSLPNCKYLSTTTMSTSVGSASSTTGSNSHHSMPRVSQQQQQVDRDFRGVPRVAVTTPTNIANMSTTPSSARHAVLNSGNHNNNHSNAIQNAIHSNGSLAGFHTEDVSLPLDIINGGMPPNSAPHSSNGHQHQQQHQQQHIQHQHHPHHGNGHSRGGSHGGERDIMPPPPPLMEGEEFGGHSRPPNMDGRQQHPNNHHRHQRQSSQPRQYFPGQEEASSRGGRGQRPYWIRSQKILAACCRVASL